MYLSNLENIFVQIEKCREASASKKFCQTKREVSERDRGESSVLVGLTELRDMNASKKSSQELYGSQFLSAAIVFLTTVKAL